MRYFLVAGEASGDYHAAALIEQLKRLDAESRFCFVGGSHMEKAAQVPPLVHIRELAQMGIWAVFRRLRHTYRLGHAVQQALLDFRPDRVVVVDFWSFNQKFITSFVKQHLPLVPVDYYIIPKVWASRRGRIATLARDYRHLLAILPHEPAYLERYGAKATFVGNPTYNEVKSLHFNTTAEERIQSRTILLLCGSRKQEIKAHLPLMLEAIAPWKDKYDIVVVRHKSLDINLFSPHLKGKRIRLETVETALPPLGTARAAIVCSGTATLEAALVGTPQIVVYRAMGGFFARRLFNLFALTPYISLVNIILGRAAVVELLGDLATPQRIRRAFADLMENSLDSATALQRELERALTEKEAAVEAAHLIFKGA